MKDSDDGVFGAFIGEGLHPSKGGGYYGSGESYVLNFFVEQNLFRYSYLPDSFGKWLVKINSECSNGPERTTTSRYVNQIIFPLVEGPFLPCLLSRYKAEMSFSDGHYGLYLDDTLSDGSSAPCPTFNNDPLCSPGPKQGGGYTFECVGLEVWGVGS